MPSAYPRLLQPITLRGGAVLRNRALMGSMHTGLEEGEGWGHSLEKMGAFFAERARGGVGLMVTGGIAPNAAGRVAPFAATMASSSDARRHRTVTEMVHEVGGAKIAMQLLHAGRYAYHPSAVAPSAKKAPIGWFTPHALSSAQVDSTIGDFAAAAALAQEAGYDGVEVMGSEGYLINQFLVSRTNQRSDAWGGSFANRMRLPVEIVRAVRGAVSDDFILIFRLSMLDLVRDGSSWEEVVELAQAVEDAGATIINTGIGWHEARVPTIATSVPRAGFAWVTQKLKGQGLSIPLVATNRINTPEVAEAVLASGQADMVSMARPLLADADFVNKAAAGTPELINTCIACNQACLDHTFKMQRASCLVNPRAGYETELNYTPTEAPLNLAVVGAGPAGLACATVAAERGHTVTLFDRSPSIGGQFNLAKQVPGKEEFYETLRYFTHKLAALPTISLQLGTEADAPSLAGYDRVVLATGVVPRSLSLPGSDHPKVVSYVDVLQRRAAVGERVAIVGAGGIGFDVAEFLMHRADKAAAAAADALSAPSLPQTEQFLAEWGINPDAMASRGGLIEAAVAEGGGGGGGGGGDDAGRLGQRRRQIYLLQRKKGKLGAGLGRTTGWIHRATLKRGGVEMVGGVQYEKVDDDGLHVKVGKAGERRVLDVDTVVVCAGQVSDASLEAPLLALGVPTFTIGGAHLAAELDAKRAIDQGSRLAASIESARPDELDSLVAPLGLAGWLFQKYTERKAS